MPQVFVCAFKDMEEALKKEGAEKGVPSFMSEDLQRGFGLDPDSMAESRVEDPKAKGNQVYQGTEDQPAETGDVELTQP